jgi:hypothetical protein
MYKTLIASCAFDESPILTDSCPGLEYHHGREEEDSQHLPWLVAQMLRFMEPGELRATASVTDTAWADPAAPAKVKPSVHGCASDPSVHNRTRHDAIADWARVAWLCSWKMGWKGT